MAEAAAAPLLPAKEPLRRRAVPWLLLLPAFLIMAYAFVLPMLVFFQYSVYTFERGRLIDEFSLATYIDFLTDPYFHTVIFDTVKMAAITTLCSALVGYPLAYALWRVNSPALKRWLGLIIFSPILVSVVVRSYGWTVLLADQGPINWFLQTVLAFPEPVKLVFNLTGVVISLTHVFLPFVVFPIFSTMTRLDPTLREASMDLGAGWWTTFRRITFPLTLPGLLAGMQICFTLALGAFVTPSLLGGGRVLVLPLQIYTATADINWPLAAVGGIVLLALAMVTVLISNRLLRYSEV
ncbi:ABC transporter permease [Mesorhizobium sp. Z1-4]|uniref:ABC transporter permease n=1 Tax=Mesorhizobium sp. Z1-4 TaxID=2448478 RepID=UPI0013DF6ADB|nr:ABC transporter permease [Mesorhizobium sp. Z1-4]